MDRLFNGFYRMCIPCNIYSWVRVHLLFYGVEYKLHEHRHFKLADGPGEKRYRIQHHFAQMENLPQGSAKTERTMKSPGLKDGLNGTQGFMYEYVPLARGSRLFFQLEASPFR